MHLPCALANLSVMSTTSKDIEYNRPRKFPYVMEDACLGILFKNDILFLKLHKKNRKGF